MARYKVLELSFINNSIVQPGDVVDINDDVTAGGMNPGSNIEIDAEVEPKRGRRKASDDLSDIA